MSWESLGLVGVADSLPQYVAAWSPDFIPPIDERSINPRGFDANPEMDIGTLASLETCWSVRVDGRVLVRLDASGSVSDADIALLRKLRGIRIEEGWHTGPVAAARVLAALASAGIPLIAAKLPSWMAGFLGDDVAALINRSNNVDLRDELRREEYSVRLRRAALRTHSRLARWSYLAGAAGTPARTAPSISVVMSSRRPQMLRFALAQLARQELADFELILVLHGVSRDSSYVKNAIGSLNTQLTLLDAPSSLQLGQALNLAASHASGSCIAKMDDDDWYGPQHLADLLLAQSYTGADVVGCAQEFVYLEQYRKTIRRRWHTERWKKPVAGGTLLMNRAIFDAVGGFRPIARAVDSYFLDAVQAAGGRIYRTHGLGYVLRRATSGHTWAQSDAYFLSRAAREWDGFCPSELLKADERCLI